MIHAERLLHDLKVANPGNFDGRRVRFTGYLGYNGIDASVGLYVPETDGRNSMIAESIDLH